MQIKRLKIKNCSGINELELQAGQKTSAGGDNDVTREVFTSIQELAVHLEKRGREISKQLARETEQEKIYVLLLAWGVEYLKLRQRVI